MSNQREETLDERNPLDPVYVTEVRYCEGDSAHFGPFDTNDAAMAFGKRISSEDEDVIGYRSISVLPQASWTGEDAIESRLDGLPMHPKRDCTQDRKLQQIVDVSEALRG